MKLLSVFSLLFFLWSVSVAQTADKPNVLFIFVDDLRPDLGVYGNTVAQTPHMDSLAAKGSAFMKHYVQVPTCGASRYAILTGKLPQSRDQLSNEVIRNYISEKPETAIPETFIHHLRRNGYYTVGIGKVSHYIDGLYGYNENLKDARPELPHSWDEKLFDAGKWKDGWDAFFAYADGSSRITMKQEVKPYEHAEVGDDGYPDGLSANLALQQIDALSQKEAPFFLAVGFMKPHLPFTAPKKYWDLYSESDITTSVAPNLPTNVNLASLHNNSEFNRYQLGEEKPTLDTPASEDYARKIWHSYYAAVSYTDAQVGKLMEKLKSSGLEENTIVILWSDHGWQLGDHRVWGKHTLFEKSLRSPLIIKDPRIKQKKKIDEIVSTIDVYPTLMELCQIAMPYSTTGRSVTQLLKAERTPTKWEQRSYSYFNEGISLRVPGYRYTKYFREEQPVLELYDHENDPHEQHNIAREHPEIVKKLDTILEQGNTGLYN